jgi:hypothetical protein
MPHHRRARRQHHTRTRPSHRGRVAARCPTAPMLEGGGWRSCASVSTSAAHKRLMGACAVCFAKLKAARPRSMLSYRFHTGHLPPDDAVLCFHPSHPIAASPARRSRCSRRCSLSAAARQSAPRSRARFILHTPKVSHLQLSLSEPSIRVPGWLACSVNNYGAVTLLACACQQKVDFRCKLDLHPCVSTTVTPHPAFAPKGVSTRANKGALRLRQLLSADVRVRVVCRVRVVVDEWAVQVRQP